ncbi:MAG: alpha/beta hydrolase [Rhodospirillaceae bacterium]|nr:alpha/beta hydrolase [Rhodospirillaceae bacterium]
MATFVLVHGAWHGGWCWARIAPRLRDLGHEVNTPTMTGFGERIHLLTPDVGLETNVTDISNVLKWEELDNVILVGASYAGMVTTSVADRMPERIAALVYINAFIAADGVSQNDMLPDWRREMIEEELAKDPGAWRMPPPAPDLIGVTDRSDAAWITDKMTIQSAKTFRDCAKITGGVDAIKNRTYIRATGYPNNTFDANLETFRANPDWRAEVIDTSHDAMITAADDVVRILEEVAASLAFDGQTERAAP